MKRSVMFRTTGVVCLLAMLPFVSGCGVIFGGTRQTIRATSSPDGTAVTTSPQTVSYTTPTSLNLQRKQEYTLTFSMAGYSSQTAQLQKDLRMGIVVADVILTGQRVLPRRPLALGYQFKYPTIDQALADIFR